MAEEAKERIDRWRTLINASFGLALGLSAFSLTNFPIRSLEDIGMALLLFATVFIIISGIWHDVHRMLRYPFSMSFAFLNYILIFLVVIMPFTFRLIVETGEIREVATILYPLDVAASMTVLAVMHQIFVRHNRDSLSKEMILWGNENGIVYSIIAVIYTASLFLPSDVKILPLPPEAPQLLQRIFLWGMAIPIGLIPAVIYEKVHGIKWTSR
jgi:uncharacterized membrane protein